MVLKPSMTGRKFKDIVLEKRFRHFSVALAAALIFSLGYGLGMQQHISAQEIFTVSPEVQYAFEPLWQIYNMIDTQYIEDVSVDKLVDGAAQGMVDALGDVYSGYMNPEEFPVLNSDLEGEFVGIGVVITTNDHEEIEVVGIIEDAPAWGSGIQPGDIFHAVDGEDISGWNQTEFAAKVRGVAGTEVVVTVRRDTELLDFTITRALIVIPNVKSELLDDDIAYVQLNNFSDDASDLLVQAFEELDVNSRTGLIVDVRGNPGGWLHSAVDVTSLFISEGAVVYEAFGDGRETTFDATGEYFELTVPMVLLINETSASASEILAGALQDTERATLIGETTLGKGTVQTWSPLMNGGGIRLTIARWLTPDRRWIHENGIAPDITVEWTPIGFEDDNDPQLEAAIGFLRGESIEALVQTSNP